jgi:hypothetical protein
MSKNNDFVRRFIELHEEGQINLNCSDANELLEDAKEVVRRESIYTKETIPDSIPLVVVARGDCCSLEVGNRGFLFWKDGGRRSSGVFMHYNQARKCWEYVDYKMLGNATFIPDYLHEDYDKDNVYNPYETF